MNRITEYKTLVEGSGRDFDAEVCEAIAAGWQPFGGPTVIQILESETDRGDVVSPAHLVAVSSTSWLVQAMVRYEEGGAE